ncbi:hypothetical protein SS39_15585 [Enterobacter chengduensis]|jgi:hypothetical protein|nr:hypothetical protein SS39_15585 [Enterobacter chengduensis]KJM01336.1 hypothetical protein SS50_14290 [Enterobacter chengduensis]OFU65531.1 hypothetical protein HMPREF3143_20215 [Enterobacter sp. HMSC16D10]
MASNAKFHPSDQLTQEETRMIEKKTKLPPSTSLMIPDATFQILFKEAKRRKMSVSALLLEECQNLAVKYSKAGA